jgi:hypothetical protein
MIETVAHEKLYKDVKHEPLCPAVPKDPMTHHTASPPPAVAPSCSTRNGGASSSSMQGFGMLKMFQGIFAMCHPSNQQLDVIEQCVEIVCRNQEIIHSQRDEPL